jgi:hypothetical protein
MRMRIASRSNGERYRMGGIRFHDFPKKRKLNGYMDGKGNRRSEPGVLDYLFYNRA